MRATLIVVSVLAIGIALYARVLRRLRREGLVEALAATVFVLFCLYGGLAVILLASLFREWPEGAVHGLMFEVIVAPIIAGAVGWTFRDRRTLSRFHEAIYRWSWGYFIGLVLVLCAAGLVWILHILQAKPVP
ncbi:MAG: hypothetical protein IPJ76_09770 [Flavobacteriales bacterium]|nr:MAG: hypothetical protein IPJ76_09770 [Flavobacteriales bacterium]